jgi:hypothetical protein
MGIRRRQNEAVDESNEKGIVTGRSRRDPLYNRFVIGLMQTEFHDM